VDRQTLPLFPLSTVLLPGGRLPLQIFELRYLDLMQRCWREGRPFGVVALQRGQEVQSLGDDGRFVTESFADIGTVAQLIHLERVQPGLLMVMAEGRERFRIHGAQRRANGLWMAEVTLLPADAVLSVPDDLQPVVHALRALLGSLRDRLTRDHAQAIAAQALPDLDDGRWSESGWAANRAAEWLPLPLEVRQRLLETDSPLLRLELAGDLLEQLGLA